MVPRIASDWAEAAEHGLEVDGAVKQREAHEQSLDQQLLLAAATKMRLDVREGCQHAHEVSDGKSGCAGRQRFARAIGDLRRCTAENDRQLRANHVAESGEKGREINAGFGESANEGKNVRRAMLRDEAQQLEELVLGHD